MQETHDRHRGRGRCRGIRLSQSGLESPEQDVQDGRGGLRAVVKEGPEALGDREHELADRDVGEHMVHHMGGRLGHVAGSAGGTGTPAAARERDPKLVTTTGAPGPGKAVSQDAALEVAPELVLHMGRHPVAHGVGFLSLGQVRLEVFPDDAVQGRVLGPATPVGLDLRAGGLGRSGSRPADLPLAGMGLGGHRRPGMSRGTGWSVSTSRRAEGRGTGMGREAMDGLVVIRLSPKLSESREGLSKWSVTLLKRHPLPPGDGATGVGSFTPDSGDRIGAALG